MNEYQYTTNVGDYLVIWITGIIGTIYIAEVTQSDPLQMKVEEAGPYAHLKQGDFIIQEADTEQLQKDNKAGTGVFLESENEAGRKVVSGLRTLGVTDDRLHEILPSQMSA